LNDADELNRLVDILSRYSEVLGELSAYSKMLEDAKTEGDLDRYLEAGNTVLGKALELIELTLPILREDECHKTASVIEGRYIELRKRYNHLRGLSDLRKWAGEYGPLCDDSNRMGDTVMLIVTAVGECREALLRRSGESDEPPTFESSDER
jgi:hypothetical protein